MLCQVVNPTRQRNCLYVIRRRRGETSHARCPFKDALRSLQRYYQIRCLYGLLRMIFAGFKVILLYVLRPLYVERPSLVLRGSAAYAASCLEGSCASCSTCYCAVNNVASCLGSYVFTDYVFTDYVFTDSAGASTDAAFHACSVPFAVASARLLVNLSGGSVS